MVEQSVGDLALEDVVGRWCGEGKCVRRCGLWWREMLGYGAVKENVSDAAVEGDFL